MEEVHDGIFVGAEQGCRSTRAGDDWAVVHACKNPCHQEAVGGRQLSKGHPDYLVVEEESDLYLNMVDMQRKQDHEFMEPMISASFDFVDKYSGSKQVLFHCNQGRSRSPTLAMLYLSKRADQLSDESYMQAANEFRELYPGFNPGQGIDLYLQDYWNQL